MQKTRCLLQYKDHLPCYEDSYHKDCIIFIMGILIHLQIVLILKRRCDVYMESLIQYRHFLFQVQGCSAREVVDISIPYIIKKGILSRTVDLISYRSTPGISLYKRPANERRRYNVTSSPIGWSHKQGDPWNSFEGSIGYMSISSQLAPALAVQCWFWVCAQPMRDVVTK